MSHPAAQERRLVLALLDATGFARACEALAPAQVHDLLARLHARLAAEVEAAGGTVVKLLGDAQLVAFDPARAAPAVALLRRLGGSPCPEVPVPRGGRPSRLQVRAHAGTVAWGPLGTAAGTRPDAVGRAVNELFLLRGGDLVLSDELERMVGRA